VVVSVTFFLPSLLESPDEWIDSDWNKEGRKLGMDIATKTRPLVYDPCSISSLSGLNLNFYEEVIPSLIALIPPQDGALHSLAAIV
jgi:hypothetical protein